MRENILDPHPSADLAVMVVWFDMLPGDTRAFTDLQVMNDHRATNYWDEEKTLGRWYGEHVSGGGGVEWDVYYLYGPGARWSDASTTLSSGGPVIGATDDLRAAMRPFVGA